MNTSTSIEALESRIAPATLTFMNNDTVAKFTDVDGDAVVIKASKGKFDSANPANNFTFNGDQLQVLNLKVGGFAGADITITATRGATGGDGFVNVGFIDADDLDLGKVTVDGDLGVIDCGNNTSEAKEASALKGLTVQSMGRFDLETGAPDHKSDIDGKLDKLTVKTDLKEVYLHVFDTETGNVNGKIGSIFVGGSIFGTAAMDNNGLIEGSGDIGAVTINGSIIGGDVAGSGGVFSQKLLGPVKIGGNVQGGIAGEQSGFIKGSDGIKSVTILGSLIGGTATKSGQITSDKSIGAVTINGSIIGGIDTFAGSIVSDGTIGAVVVKGSLLGTAAHPVVISAKGVVNPSSDAQALAIKSVTVNGSVERAQILAGHDSQGDANNADVQIGAIKVVGDWIASSAVAGAKATNNKFGDQNSDSLIAGGNAIVSKIAKIAIGGMAYGTPAGKSNADFYGFVAQKVSAISVGGVAFPVSDATANESVKIGWTNDLFVDEVV